MTIVFALSAFIINIADVMLVVGSTSCTLIGFNIPMMLYLKLHKIENGDRWDIYKVLAILVFISLTCISVASLVMFTISKLN